VQSSSTPRPAQPRAQPRRARFRPARSVCFAFTQPPPRGRPYEENNPAGQSRWFPPEESAPCVLHTLERKRGFQYQLVVSILKHVVGVAASRHEASLPRHSPAPPYSTLGLAVVHEPRARTLPMPRAKGCDRFCAACHSIWLESHAPTELGVQRHQPWLVLRRFFPLSLRRPQPRNQVRPSLTRPPMLPTSSWWPANPTRHINEVPAWRASSPADQRTNCDPAARRHPAA